MRVLNEAPKGFIYKMLRKKNITLNDKKATGNEIIKKDDVLSIFLSDETFDKFSKAKGISEKAGTLDVLYEDDNIVIVNKEAGLLSHPDAGSDGDSVSERLIKHLRDSGEYDPADTSAFAPVICNRLDRNTSGIIICAKNMISAREIASALKERAIAKFYIAAVVGEVKGSGVLKAYHVKNSEDNTVIIYNKPNKDAKAIITEYEAIKSNEKYSLLKINLVTGKSHQIRAMMANMGHPVLGDGKYGDMTVNGMLFRRFGLKYQLLHAQSIVFGNFTGNLSYLSGKKFECQPSEQFTKVMKIIGL
jgi:23S rRNA pseudouridine955/2504/2580 synthase